VPVWSFVRQLLYLFSERFFPLQKERFVKLCRRDIFRQQIHFVSIFQLEETKQGETKFQLHNMGQQAEAKYAFVVSLASFLLFFFLSSFNQIDSCRGGGGVFTLVTIPKYSICADLIKLVAVWGKPSKSL
jgi:hypothetical protein